MRIEKHPILEFHKGKNLKFTFNGNEIEGFEGFHIDQEVFTVQLETVHHA